MKFFSVLIANYNNAPYIEEAIESVLVQTYKNWEIIIVDDASTDNSLEILSKYENNSSIHIYRNEENKGCGYTKSRCAEIATGEICGFLDPDDALSEEAIEIMMDSHNIHLECSLIYSTAYLCDDQLNIVEVDQQTGDVKENYILSKGKKVSHFATFKKGLYNKTAGINPKLKRAVDQDLYYKLEEMGELKFIDVPLYYYRRHAGGISLGKNVRKAKYWHIMTLKEAYKRRRNTKLEFSKKLINNNKIYYYYLLLEEAKAEEQRAKYKTAYCNLALLNLFSHPKVAIKYFINTAKSLFT